MRGDLLRGRAEERTSLRDTIESARGGQSRVLVVRGEPGVGKTALLDDLVAAAPDLTVLRGSGVESEVELAYAGLHALLRPLLPLADQLPAGQAAALRSALGYGDGDADRLTVAPAVLDLLAEATEHQPLLAVIDDTQWLDQPTLDALTFVARRLRAEPVAIVLAARLPGDGADPLSDLPELHLSGLDLAAAEQVLADQDVDLAPRVRTELIAQTGGNPLGLVELARQLSPEQRQGSVPLPSRIPLGQRLQQAFAADAAGLAEPTRQILLIAAAEEAGDLNIVVAAAGRLGAGAADFAPAERAGLIQLEGATIRFRHPLIRAALYWDATYSQRATAHQAVADALHAADCDDQAAWHRAIAASGPDEAIAAELERAAEPMLRRGGAAAVATILHRAATLSTTKAARARRLLRAARAAWTAGRPEQAHNLLDQARPLVTDETERAELGALLALVEKEVGGLATAYQAGIMVVGLVAKHSREAGIGVLLSILDTAWDASDEAGMTTAAQRLTDLADGTPYAPLAAMLAGWAGTGYVPGNRTDTTELRRVAEWLFAMDKPETWLWPGFLAFHSGHYELAYEFAQQAARRLRSAGMAGLLTGAFIPLTRICLALGRWSEAEALIAEGLLLCRDTGQSSRAASLLADRALLAAARGDADQCRQASGEALTIALPRGIASAAARTTWARGTLAASLGKPDDAHRDLSDVYCPDGPYTHHYFKRPATVEYVEACVRVGRTAEAEAVVAEFATWVQRTRLTWAQAHLHRCQALLGHDDVDHHFEQALHEGYGAMPFEQARTALQFGEWLRRDRRPTQAQIHLRAALETFEGLGAREWAAVAGTQLRSAGGQFQRKSAASAAVLTAQEQQIAKFASAGLSNPEIAAQLFISPRTVGYHLSKIYTKLGVSTRKQLRDLDGALTSAF